MRVSTRHPVRTTSNPPAGPTRVLTNRRTRLAAALAVLLVPAAPLSAQQPVFSVDDVLNLNNARVAEISPDGRWAIVATATLRDRLGRDNARYGDPTYVAPSLATYSIVDTGSGQATPLFDGPRQAASFAWSPDGSRVAYLDRADDTFRLVIWERERNRRREVPLAAGRIITEDASLQWSADGSRLLFTMRTAEWFERARQRFNEEVRGPIVVQSSEEPFLSWESIRRLSLEQIPALYSVADNRVTEIMPESRLGSVSLSGDASMLIYEEDTTKKTSYEEIFGTDEKLVVKPIGAGESRVLFDDMEDMTLRWDGDNRSFVYSKEGRTYFGTIDGGEPRQLTGEPPRQPGQAAAEEPADSASRKAERERRARLRFAPLRLSHDGSTMLASNSEGYWLIDTATGQTRTKILDVPGDEEDETSPRYGAIAWSRDGNDLYLSYASRTEWERGVMHYDRDTGVLEDLVKDGRTYSGIRLSDDGSTFVLTIAAGNHPGDVYVTDSRFSGIRRLTESNPGIESRLARTELIKYLDVDGDELYGVLY